MDIYYRSAQELKISNQEYKILLIGSCYIDSLYTEFKKIYPVHTYFYHNLTSDINFNLDYDFIIVNYPLRYLEIECNFFKVDYNQNDASKYYEETLLKLYLELDKFIQTSQKLKIPLFCIGYIIPQFPTMGRLFKRHCLTNHAYFVQKLNESLENYLLKHLNCYYVDAESSISTHGKKTFLDDMRFIESHNTFSYENSIDFVQIDNYKSSREILGPTCFVHFESICVEIISMYRSLNRTDEIKLVIFDLDGIIWRGVPGEGIIETNEGWPAGIQESILILKKRGILLAICSKNDESFIKNNWDTFVQKRVPWDYFCIKKINFEPKVQNIKEILNITNILTSNVLFVDDHPIERESVKNAFPNMRVIGDDIVFLKKILLTCSELQPIILTKESTNRSASIKQKVINEKYETSNDFLDTIDLKLTIERTQLFHLNRVLELFNKTNQFNSVGYRYSFDQLHSLIEGNLIYHGHVSDKYVDYGIMISLILKDNVIEHIVMSCRIFNLQVENAFLKCIMEKMSSDYIKVCFKSTDRNNPCLSSLIQCGFDMKNISLTKISQHSMHKNDFINLSNHILVKHKLK
jgi:FkbH-like protein